MAIKHPGSAVLPTQVMEGDDFEEYKDVGTDSDVSGEELYVAIGDEEYRVDQRRVNDLEIASLTEVIGNLIALTQGGGTIEEVDKLQWRATRLVCRMCPDIPETTASCDIVYYTSSEDTALKGFSYRGRMLYMTLEEMVILMGTAMQAYHNNRPKRIQDFVAFNSDRISDEKTMRLQKVIEADQERAKVLDTDFTDNIIDGYLEYARQLETASEASNPVSRHQVPEPRKRTPLASTPNPRRKRKRPGV